MRWSLAAAIGLLTLGLTRGRGLRAGLGVVRQWPQAIFCASGLAWWLWLEPSAAGWLLVAIGLLLSLPGRRSREDRDPASAVARRSPFAIK